MMHMNAEKAYMAVKWLLLVAILVTLLYSVSPLYIFLSLCTGIFLSVQVGF